MDWRDVTKIRLLADFDGSFFNEREEFIAHRYSNTYFIFSNCESLEDVNCKVLEWLSRAADKGIPYRQNWSNKKFQKFMLDGINMFLNTDFSKEDIDLIYTYLGNSCNHNRTLEFVSSGYDMELLRKLENKENN